MRDFKGMKRQRGRNRKPGGNNANSANPNRSWDSQGPENIKVRGNAQTVYERYMQLARDAASAGDRVLAENYLQHAEHYFRVLRALQPQRPVSEIAQRELSNQGFDIDFEDESGAQAAAFLAAQQAQQAQQNNQSNGGNPSGPQPQGQQAQTNDRDRDRDRDRERDRDRDRDGGNDGETRSEGEGGSRRETRRERWERRKDEQRGRRSSQDSDSDVSEPRSDADQQGSGDIPVGPTEDPAETVARPARKPRRPREDAPVRDASDADALPGFLTRPTPRAAEAPPAPDLEEAAPRRRAPRKKAPAETVDSGE